MGFGFDPEFLYIGRKRGLRIQGNPDSVESCGRHDGPFPARLLEDVPGLDFDPLE